MTPHGSAGQGGPNGERYRFGDIVVDFARQTATTGGMQGALTLLPERECIADVGGGTEAPCDDGRALTTPSGIVARLARSCHCDCSARIVFSRSARFWASRSTPSWRARASA